MFIALCTLWAFMFQHRVSTKKRDLTDFLWEGKTHVFTWVFGCVPFIFGGYLSLMAGIQLAWHRLAKERTSKMPNTQPQTPSSSSKMKLYSGHKARHGPRHLREWMKCYWFDTVIDKSLHISWLSFFSLSHADTPVSYDIWMSSTRLWPTLCPQVKLADHSIQLHLSTQPLNHVSSHTNV